MPNRKVGSKPVERKNFSCLNEDSQLLSQLTILFDLSGGVSAIIRVFLRIYEKFKDTNLIDLSIQLQSKGKPTTLSGLMELIIEENDRVQVEQKNKGKVNVQKSNTP